MTTNQEKLLIIAATALTAYSAGTYIFGLRGPLDALGPASGTESKTLEFGGRTRTYLIHPPKGYDGKTPLPLVLVLHGAVQGAINVERMSGMSAKADKENFLVVYPNGTSRSGLAPTWNAGACCGYALINKVDDVGFLRALIDRLEHDYTIDPKHIFVTGISNGGMMSYRLACELADRVAAIAPVEGAQDLECHPSGPVSVVIFHGTADFLVPYNGGRTPFQIGPKRTDTPVTSTVAFWMKQDGCSTTPKHEETTQLRIDTYSGCKDGAGVALYTIRGGHHMWPGARLSRNDVPATDIMWSFFAAHPKGAAGTGQ
jgi:polyhydroxybutyrate depolymerase